MANFISLKRNEDILNIIKKQQKIHSNHIVVYFCETNLKKVRLAISISKKKFKLATQRNRIRRLIKAWFIAANVLVESYDIVVLVKPSFIDGSFVLNCDNIKKILQIIISKHKQNKINK